jgi:ATP-dependent RNA helicase MSS116
MAVAATAPPVDAARRHFSQRKFAEAPISSASKAGIKHEYMTDVQDATIDLALAGCDLLVQAKTGTGKTVAFLLPTIERLTKLPRPPSPQSISILILSPTRELACQIEEEAKVLLKHHPLEAQHAIGGTNINTEQKRIHNQRCDILVATPGRLIDLLENHNVRPKFTNLKALVFDEADRLLDAGFRRELQKIVGMMPDRKLVPRQVLLFSATVSEEIKQIASLALNHDHKFVSTLLAEEVNTHEHVEQSYIIAPFADALPATLFVLREDLARHPHTSKCMVFFPTARHTGLAKDVLSRISGLPTVLEIHSRMSQGARTTAANTFKDARSAVLLSSDVAARGMDFPGVTLVLQTGLPANSEQYVHRLGRTARAGAAGRGVLILAPPEQFFLRARTVRDLPIRPHALPATAVPRTAVAVALDAVGDAPKAAAYQAWLGYYKGSLRDLRWDAGALVAQANAYVLDALRYGGAGGGLPPPIMAKTVGKMGIRGTAGLNVVMVLPDARGTGPGGGRGGGNPGRVGAVRGGGRKRVLEKPS